MTTPGEWPADAIVYDLKADHVHWPRLEHQHERSRLWLFGPHAPVPRRSTRVRAPVSYTREHVLK